MPADSGQPQRTRITFWCSCLIIVQIVIPMNCLTWIKRVWSPILVCCSGVIHGPQTGTECCPHKSNRPRWPWMCNDGFKKSSSLHVHCTKSHRPFELFANANCDFWNEAKMNVTFERGSAQDPLAWSSLMLLRKESACQLHSLAWLCLQQQLVLHHPEQNVFWEFCGGQNVQPSSHTCAWSLMPSSETFFTTCEGLG